MDKPFSIRNKTTLEVVTEADTLTEALKLITKLETEDDKLVVFDNVSEEVIC
jgi:hypothetical protein